jgi:hypothetical protein
MAAFFSRRRFLAGALLLTAIAGGSAYAAVVRQAQGASALPTVTTYRDPGCGCCILWVEHMRQAGFEVIVRNTPDMPSVRTRLGVAPHLQACHTSVVGNYVVEGHVPADDVKRLLREQPDVRGIAVPGMPIGSPGMEQGPVKHAYSTLAFDEKGQTTVFERH